jgi:hypothetical protein
MALVCTAGAQKARVREVYIPTTDSNGQLVVLELDELEAVLVCFPECNTCSRMNILHALYKF